MALISFILGSFSAEQSSSSAVNKIARPQRARLKQIGPESSGLEFVFPFGPQDINFGDFGLSYDTTDRPGGKAVLTAVTQNLRTLSVDAILANKYTSGKSSIEGMISTFVRMSEEPYDCAFTYGVVTLPYRVRITSLDYNSVRRDGDGNITQAELSFELTENVGINQSIVTLTAITYDPAPSASSSTKNPSKAKPKPSGEPDTGYPYFVPGDGSLARTGSTNRLVG